MASSLLGAVWEVVLIVAVQCWMLMQVSFGYWRLCRKSVREPVPWALGYGGVACDAMVSVIIPAYREKGTIEATLRRVLAASGEPQLLEIVVVDAGGEDGTTAIAERVAKEVAGQLTIHCDVTSRGGRGPAVAAGARRSRGDVLLFLHSDTALPRGFDVDVREALRDGRHLATCFKFGVDREALDGPLATKGTLLRRLQELPFDVMEATVGVRSSALQLPFGDQALALKRETFVALGGLDDLGELPILEDFLLVHKLRVAGAAGRGKILNLKQSAHCHPRRWLAKPVWKVNWTNQRVMILFTYYGYTPLQIYDLYYGTKQGATT